MIPAARFAGRASASTLPAPPNQSKGIAPMPDPSILLIDDDPFALDLMAHYVGEMFALSAVFTLEAGDQASILCRENTIDCVVVDYNMPGQNGLDLAKSLRREFPYMAIILCTGSGDESLVAYALTNGVSDYIPKSKLSAESLGRTIRNAVQSGLQSKIIDTQRKELEDFSYALAHDFKQPLRQIMVFTSLIGAALGDKRDDDMTRNLNFLHRAAKRLDALVDVMSQYTLLNKPPDISEVDLDAVVEDVRSSLENYLRESGGRIVSASGPRVRGHAALVGQVLQNLIVNGLKYNRNDEPIVHISMVNAGGFCEFCVADNGIGIESQFAEQIFGVFKRLHGHDEYPGSGIGLAICQRVVEQYGGRIWLEQSSIGSGSMRAMQLLQADQDRRGTGSAHALTPSRPRHSRCGRPTC